MTVKELILQLLERPMTDNVVFHDEDKKTSGHWSDLQESHIRPGNGITIIDLEDEGP